MDIIYSSVAGFDVHQKTVVVAVRSALAGQGRKVQEEVRTFGTVTRDILQLRDWLKARQVSHVAMEATGVLWKPIWNLLEGHFALMLVNPRELKQVPGRKSDVRDCQWIAQLLQCGLLRSSFVPPRAQRELRDLTRYRAQLVAEHTRAVNRLHKVLEDANLKLATVASDILGKSGRAMLQALLAGEQDAARLAELARTRLRGKIPALRQALHGHFTEHHRFLVRSLLRDLDFLQAQIDGLSVRIEQGLRPLLTPEDQERLDAVPGVNQRTIENVVAEIGTNMEVFPSADHLSSWAGLCPRTEESAGKRKRSRSAHGNRWLRRAMAEAAWAASHTKNSYWAAQYRRLAGRRGKKRALIAVAHSQLQTLYHVLKHHAAYKDLGADYFDHLNPERIRRYLVKRLEGLGYQVALQPKEEAA